MCKMHWPLEMNPLFWSSQLEWTMHVKFPVALVSLFSIFCRDWNQEHEFWKSEHSQVVQSIQPQGHSLLRMSNVTPFCLFLNYIVELTTIAFLFVSCPNPHDEPINMQLYHVLAPAAFFQDEDENFNIWTSALCCCLLHFLNNDQNPSSWCLMEKGVSHAAT